MNTPRRRPSSRISSFPSQPAAWSASFPNCGTVSLLYCLPPSITDYPSSLLSCIIEFQLTVSFYRTRTLPPRETLCQTQPQGRIQRQRYVRRWRVQTWEERQENNGLRGGTTTEKEAEVDDNNQEFGASALVVGSTISWSMDLYRKSWGIFDFCRMDPWSS